jgi:predicted DNA binding CopG/RHH family protein
MTFELPKDRRITIRLNDELMEEVQKVVDYMNEESIDTDNSKLVRFILHKGLEKLKLEGKIKS